MPQVPNDQNPFQLYADEYTEDDRSELIHLNCGDEAWARAATEWMIGTEVRDAIEKRGTRVWLYRNEQGVIVGFGDRHGDGGHHRTVVTPIS